MACQDCKWFDTEYAPDDDPEEALGLCQWPAENLPWSLRWANRERTAVGPLEGDNCSCFKSK